MVETICRFWGAMGAGWNALPHEVQAAFITAATTALAALLGFGAVVLQIGAQARAAIAANQDNEARKLKVRIYEDVEKQCHGASDAWVEFGGSIRLFITLVRQARQLSDAGQPFPIPSVKTREVLDRSRLASDAAVALVRAAEGWKIVDPRLEVFQTAFSAAAHDVRIAFNRDFFPRLVPISPVPDPATATTHPWGPPPQAQLDELERLAEASTNAASTMVAYIDDFQRAMQNLLLGELFGNRVPSRAPINPAYRAITLDEHKALTAYFFEQTPWGESAAKAKAGAEADMKASSVTGARKDP
jgi:hypothetical protein